MFDYPISVPRENAYAGLGLGPEALAEEISDAKLELTQSIKASQRVLQRQLDEVHRAVDGLQGAYEQLNRILAAGEAANPQELKAAQSALAKLEQRALQIDPAFVKNRERASELERKIHALNRLSLQNPADRLEYDQQNPPLEIIKLADCRHEWFFDNKLVLRLLRRELSEFLELNDEPVSYPSDLHRRDFRDDFTVTPLLDEVSDE